MKSPNSSLNRGSLISNMSRTQNAIPKKDKKKKSTNISL